MTGSPPLPRLGSGTIGHARAGTILPGYDRGALETGIVHLGLGAFARAHLATFTEDVLAQRSGPWGIVGVSLRHPEQRDRLAPQDGLYTALEREGGQLRARIVGCLRQVILAPADPAATIRLLAAQSCRIVSLTITEKGYCHDPATGALDPAHPDIAHDLAHPDLPRSALGLLVAALKARRDAGLGPPTVLCCDNLPHNGAMLSGLVGSFASACDDALASWIERNAAFPSTMVDRIVPATSPADHEDAARATGLSDAAPVSHEPFRQWVIEDRFAAARPAWEIAGAQLVSDVAPYEHMKLRLLNGAHSALAYLGALAGHETIASVVADPDFRAYAGAFWAEVAPIVPEPPGVDLPGYAADLLARFSNDAIRHRTAQIATDGSQKLPQRLLRSARELLARQRPIGALALAVAAWIRYVRGDGEDGRPLEVRDPLAEQIQARLRDAGPEPDRQLRAILGVAPVFGADLPSMDTFVAPVSDAYARLCAVGAQPAVRHLLQRRA